MPPPAFVFVQIKIKIKNLSPASVSSKSGLRNNGIIFFGLSDNFMKFRKDLIVWETNEEAYL